MTEQLTAVEINCATGEETLRLLTAKEIADMETRAAKFIQEEKDKEAAEAAKAALKASAKAKLIAGQPLTAEEADVLVL